ncbi:MAG: hypothetical protein AB8G22_28265 [Saprospiraceae bacterium]
MKFFVSLILCCFCCAALHAQESVVLESGTVTFISTRNVYVKFKSTQQIKTQDTLFVENAGRLIPVLKVENKSSSSTVCSPIGSRKMKVDEVVVARIAPPLPPIEDPASTEKEPALNDPFNTNQAQIPANDPVLKPDEDEDINDANVLFKEKIKGRLSAASYSNLSNYQNLHRMRYAFSLRAYNIKNSRFSVDNYITFRHTLNDTMALADMLKVYALSVRYDFDQNMTLTFGRKINPKFSSMGAIDGLQAEKTWNNVSVGVVAGTRPDFRDYSFNAQLPQFGGYVSLSSNAESKYSQSTLGFIQQMNSGSIDRRFVYFQHSSTLAKNLDLFSSFEVDLFENINNEIRNNARLTNLYASLRYRINRKWRLSMSYDNRRNIIYYESYKTFIDQYIEDETRQGLRFGISNHATRNIFWGLTANVRFQGSQRNPARNASAYVTFNRVPFIKSRATIRTSYLQTDFLTSQMASVNFSKDLLRNKLNASVYYRWIYYQYTAGDRTLNQHIGGASLNFRIQKNLSLNLFYEGTFDSSNKVFNRFNLKLIKRF